jgi:hypothetical protein
MPKDSKAPATKQDIQMVMTALGKLYDANERRKDEIIGEVDGKIDAKIVASEERVKHHFDLAVETIRHDLKGANKDRLADHEDRIVRLEEHSVVRSNKADPELPNR